MPRKLKDVDEDYVPTTVRVLVPCTVGMHRPSSHEARNDSHVTQLVIQLCPPDAFYLTGESYSGLPARTTV